MRIHTMQPEYNLAMGECKMQLENSKKPFNLLQCGPDEAPEYFQLEALIRCLIMRNFLTSPGAGGSCHSHHRGKPLFIFYLSAIYFALGRSKEGLLQLEKQ